MKNVTLEELISAEVKTFLGALVLCEFRSGIATRDYFSILISRAMWGRRLLPANRH